MKDVWINSVYHVLENQGNVARRKIVNIMCNLFLDEQKLYFVNES